jgi:hypothetical protein
MKINFGKIKSNSVKNSIDGIKQNIKYTFFKNKLKSDIQEQRDLLLDMYPKLGEGYRLVQLFSASKKTP